MAQLLLVNNFLDNFLPTMIVFDRLYTVNLESGGDFLREEREIGANQFVQDALKQLLLRIEKTHKTDLLTLFSPLYPPIDSKLRTSVELIPRKKQTLLVILETDGGIIEVVQRIVDILRKHYNRVEFLIPNRAMSAGTVLTLSGDEILMDYYGILGPIDPQIRLERNRSYVPALGYLAQYQKLLEKANSGGLNTAEMAILLKFDQAELYQYEQAKGLSVRLLKEWLVKYKFKNWKQTERRGIKVTRKMRLDRAEKIANALNDIDRWHTHGRGIPMQVLRRELELKINDFEKDKELSEGVREYYTLMSDYLLMIGGGAVIHTRETFVPLKWS